MTKRIAIIGGSIAGCAMAIVLQRLGFTVDIYERSTQNFEDRGAGICLPIDLHQQLCKSDIFDVDTPHISIAGRQFTTAKDANNQLLWTQPIDAHAFNWQTIFQQLRKRLNDASYHPGQTLTKIIPSSDNATLCFADGKSITADWIFAADGIDSTIRAQCGNENRQYAHYIAWRGTLDTTLLQQPDFFQTGNYIGYPHGHAIAYLIPGPHGKTLLNWVVYEVLNDENRHFVLSKEANKARYQTTISKDQFTAEQRTYLHNLANQYFSDHIGHMLKHTPQPFIQNIFDISLPTLQQGKICFIGDAAFTARPHVAAGATKALSGALLLKHCIENADSIDTGISTWAEKQLATESPLHELGQILGQALVTNTPDWPAMNPDKMTAWWENIMTKRQWYATPDTK